MFPFQMVIVFKIGLIHSVGVDGNRVLLFCRTRNSKTNEIYLPIVVRVNQYLAASMQ